MNDQKLSAALHGSLRVRRVHPDASLPSRAHPDDAGADLRADIRFTVGPGERVLVPTGVAVEVPGGCVGLVCPRAGLADRHGVTVLNAPGVVDAGFRGEVHVLIINHGKRPVSYEPGDRIAQLLVVPLGPAVLVEVDELTPTDRGAGGFGSTGVA